MKIYNSAGDVLLDINVDDSSYRYRAIMGDNNVVLKYQLAEHVELPVGAYIVYQADKYTLERPEAFKKQHNRYFDYTVTFEGAEAHAKIWKFRNPVDHRLKFSLTATPREHLQMFVDNMNNRETGWTVGDCIEAAEHLISYDHAYCIEALQQMASEFETEYEIVGRCVSLRKVEYNKDNPLPLSYGKGNGFKSGLARSNSGDNPPCEILFPQGGSDNIDLSKYGGSELHLPKAQVISYDGEYFEDEEGFNASNARRYVTSDDGLSLQRLDKELSSKAEDSLDCSDIYPQRVGTISEVVCVDEDDNFYDIIDADIPANLDYEKYLIDGETMTVVFQDGMLANGNEFEVKYIHEAKKVNGVEKAARRFEITPQEIDGVTMPNETFKPVAGNHYAVFNVMLPDEYICDNETKTGAEWDMFRTCVKKLYELEEEKFSFTGELDGLWAKKDWTNIGGRIKLGGFVLYSDESFQQEGVLVRITGIKDYINNPHSPTIELSNETITGGFTSAVKDIASQEVVVEDNHQKALQFTKRRFRDAKETMSMLEAALLSNFTNSITPISVQTMSMLVGDESLQFRFINSLTWQQAVDPVITYNSTTKQLTVASCLLQHMTLGITTVSAEHSYSEYLYWRMSAFTSAVLDDSDARYYLYARVSRNVTAGVPGTGVFVLDTTAHAIESEEAYYYLLVGILNSEYDGARSYVSLYGFTEILPGRVTTDKIVSTDGDTYFDLLNGVICGKIKFLSGSDGLSKLDGYTDLTDSISDAQTAANNAQSTADTANNAVKDLDSYVNDAFRDGIITEAEAQAIATYINTVNNTKAAVQASYAQLYANTYLTGVAKTGLSDAYNTLITSISNLITSINTAIADSKTTDAESKDVNDKFDAYNTAYAAYNKAVEVATNSIISVINKKAEDAQSTADQAVTDAKNAQTTANSALTSATEANTAISNLNDYVDGAFKDGIIDETEAQAIATYINTVNNTKAAVQASYEKLYYSDYLSDSGKEALKSAYDTLMSAISTLTESINTAIADGKATEDESKTVDTNFDKFNTAFSKYNTAVETAYNDIRANILISADTSAKEEVAKLGETIIEGGYIRTDLIKATELIVRHVLIETGVDGDNRKIELSPDNMAMDMYDKDGNLCTSFEGNTYSALTDLFGDTSGTAVIKSRSYKSDGTSETTYGYASGVTLGRGKTITVRGLPYNPITDEYPDANEYSQEIILSDVWHTDTPTEVVTAGHLYTHAYSVREDDRLQEETTGTNAIKPTRLSWAYALLTVAVETYSDEELTKKLEIKTIVSCGVSSAADQLVDTSALQQDSSKLLDITGKSTKTVAGYHRLKLVIYLSAQASASNYAEANWGYISTNTSRKDLSATYKSDFYVSRFFANGFCLGRRSDNYVMVMQDKNNNMLLQTENSGYGLQCSSSGILAKHHSGNWMKLPQLVFYGRAYYYSPSSGSATYNWAQSQSFDGSIPTLSRVNKGQIKLTFPTSWTTKLGTLSLTNLMFNILGYGQDTDSDNPLKANLYAFSSTSMTVTISDDASENDGSFLINIWAI
jgi:ribosomal protein L17